MEGLTGTMELLTEHLTILQQTHMLIGGLMLPITVMAMAEAGAMVEALDSVEVGATVEALDSVEVGDGGGKR